MDAILVRGGGPLSGSIPIAGAKNASLALMPATLLSEEPLTLINAPRLSDIRTMTQLLQSLGAEITTLQEGRVISMSCHGDINTRAEYDIVRKMRASNLVLGPLLAREGYAEVSLPGGCAIGARPMDIHTDGLEKMGASIDLRDGYLYAKAAGGRLKGAVIDFPFASVGATENIMMAATLAKGTTVINNAAREPEIVDLADCLRRMGAQIEGDGTPSITIQGVDRLGAATHPVVTDRIELGTYMLAPAICGGEVELLGGRIDLIGAFCEKLDLAGIDVTETEKGLKVKRRGDRVKAVDVTTEPFPGFPTDLQAQMMALLCTAEGTSTLEEKIFENRFMHAPELIRMGAKVDVHGGKAIVTGVDKLKGAPVMATDLRASVSLILAGMAAEGETKVSRVYHLDRGYEHVVAKLRGVGADIERIKDE
ncbi:UDP-N-acetylglucosamine 1-carboxyvinyltransferase [Sulfitobacter donghicola]|uniref:UDP-N-acetylglucosamine 1-carboxyvinyltransferase n=1 Tax=Sulfitobacter donghicola DSW-25 = KCTC 12864 = JCM 14565 TaxID=1300350 RepID=A0A073IJI1_9RHOB|nr:UDP-N-acetylglucosamine 1-carboxyvinyltransferase [Sulfitobacter donghicola]KEJ89676.1 UDP-N-acetylglucosamine 1-carboxyvinyltransferase [Sulfitobacter donghicola DSW-25 = KCTC 12864 = JCM 14565]KIN67235.1 UDP-N-acetylglucosamine 1-carboxyvinyltransferase [Sulfitobacter donghicola DSW-25 = KCTC 12864 = JCM 14565]